MLAMKSSSHYPTENPVHKIIIDDGIMLAQRMPFKTTLVEKMGQLFLSKYLTNPELALDGAEASEFIVKMDDTGRFLFKNVQVASIPTAQERPNGSDRKLLRFPEIRCPEFYHDNNRLAMCINLERFMPTVPQELSDSIWNQMFLRIAGLDSMISRNFNTGMGYYEGESQALRYNNMSGSQIINNSRGIDQEFINMLYDAFEANMPFIQESGYLGLLEWIFEGMEDSLDYLDEVTNLDNLDSVCKFLVDWECRRNRIDPQSVDSEEIVRAYAENFKYGMENHIDRSLGIIERYS